jgi:hypothetical protein
MEACFVEIPPSEPNNIISFSVSDTNLPCDIAAILRSGLTGVSSVDSFESLSVRFEDGGMTVMRSSEDIPFAPFSGIYCEQFYRRIVSAITPLQQLHIRRIADQRPLDLVECMLELRKLAHSPHATIKLVHEHMKRLFSARDVAIYIPLDNAEQTTIIKLMECGEPASEVPGCLNTSAILTEFSDKATDGVFLVPLEPDIADILKPPSQLNMTREKVDERSSPDTILRIERHLVPVVKGRQTIMVFEWWNADSTSPDDGFEDPKALLETFFDPESAHHKSILKAYANILEGILATWFKAANSTFSQLQEFNSYDVESLVEERLIKDITSGRTSRSKR